MRTSSVTESYLRAIRSHLRVSRAKADRIIEELRDHLAQETERGLQEGLTPAEAETRACERLGRASAVARSFGTDLTWWGRLFVLAFAVTLALPGLVMPEHMSLWTALAGIGIGAAAGYLAGRRGMAAGAFTVVVLAFFVAALRFWIVINIVTRMPGLMNSMKADAILSVPYALTLVLLGAAGGALGSRLRQGTPATA